METAFKELYLCNFIILSQMKGEKSLLEAAATPS